MSLCHAGVASIVTAIRDSFWIVGLRPIAKNVVKHCMICRRLESKPCGAIAASLSTDRVQPACPFVVTGVDFAGPLYTVDCPGEKVLHLSIYMHDCSSSSLRTCSVIDHL